MNSVLVFGFHFWLEIEKYMRERKNEEGWREGGGRIIYEMVYKMKTINLI